MKPTLIALFALCSGLAFADETSTSSAESKELALPDFSDLKQPTPKSALSNVRVDMNCQTDDGQTFKSTDAGFATCMAKKGKQ